MKQFLFIFLIVTFITSCGTFDIDRYSDMIMKSDGESLDKILTPENINRIKCNNPDNYYIYAALYVKYHGFNKYARVLLEKALSESNIFYDDAYDMYFKEALKSERLELAGNLVRKYGVNKNLKYSDFLYNFTNNVNPDSIKTVNGEKDLSNGVLFLVIGNKKHRDEFIPLLKDYLISIYDNKTDNFNINKRLFKLSIKDSGSNYLTLVEEIINNDKITYSRILNALKEACNEKEIDFLKKILLVNGRKSEFRLALDSLKNRERHYTYSWIITNRNIYGHKYIKSHLEKLLNEYDKESEEYYNLKGYQLYSANFSKDNYLDEIVEYSNLHPGKYHSYTILMDTLRYILTNRSGNYYRDTLLKLKFDNMNSVNCSTICNMLSLIYPDDKRFTDFLENKFPLSYGVLRVKPEIIKERINETTNINLSETAKISLKKINYFITYNLYDNIINFEPAATNDKEKGVIFSKIRDYLYTKGDYYKALAFSKKIAVTLYTDIFSEMDKDTFYNLYPLHYKDIILKYSKEFDVDPALAYAIMREESHYKKDITSSAQAVGLMQIMPSTAAWLSPKLNIKNIDLTDPDQNIRFGIYYLSYLMERVDEKQLIMAGYNAGHGRAVRWKYSFNNYQHDAKYELIPLEETRHYIRKVMQSYYSYKYILDNEKIFFTEDNNREKVSKSRFLQKS